MEKGLVKIFVPSFKEGSSDPKILIDRNSDTSKYWSSQDNESNKYILFSFKYKLKITGIGFSNYFKDLYSGYNVSISNDLIKWDAYHDFSITNRDISQDYIYIYEPINFIKYERFVKVTPLSTRQEYTTNNNNYAFYQIDFFGKLFPMILTFKTSINLTVSFILLFTFIVI